MHYIQPFYTHPKHPPDNTTARSCSKRLTHTACSCFVCGTPSQPQMARTCARPPSIPLFSGTSTAPASRSPGALLHLFGDSDEVEGEPADQDLQARTVVEDVIEFEFDVSVDVEVDVHMGMEMDEVEMDVTVYSFEPGDPVLEAVETVLEIVHAEATSNVRMTGELAEILPHVLLGDGLCAMDKQNLNALGVNYVVNCASGSTLTSASFYDDHYAYLSFDAKDAPEYHLLDQHFEEFEAFLDSCHVNNSRALVHCAAGINRSATLCVAYFMVKTGSKLFDSVWHCVQARPTILKNHGFVFQLVLFAQEHGLL
eukprot:m.354314 g.354314  ORF g.354314 m.354314 type:complete len:312 (+) comp16979_c0_seq1:99-1034(+)